MSETIVKKTVKNNRGRSLPNPGPGRPKGSKNKFSTEIKDAIEAAYKKMGGRDDFIKWLEAHKSEFYRFLLHNVPIEIELGGEVIHKLSITGLKKSLNDFKENGS